uniref:Ectonucleoside triphosphate diphosphohydrolase 2b n=1 Tax=Sinocyclocheilus anshuiensis TaxID=1608454 RepID=A0A671MQA8_9TELE
MDNQFVKFVVSATLFLFGMVSILLLTVSIHEIREPPEYTLRTSYGIVLDAGSSHIALYIYRWPADKLNGTGVVTQHSECHVKGGGISSYAGQQGAAGHSLEACLKKAKRDIPPDRHHCTPVYLGATLNRMTLRLYGQENSLYTHSYLCYGKEETLCQILAYLVEMTKKAPDLKKYLKDYCAVAVYIQVLMFRGYNFDERFFPKRFSMLQAGEASVGWALGYILSVSSLLPEEPVGIRKGLCPAAWIGLLILLTVLFTATFCYIALLVIRRERRNEGVS